MICINIHTSIEIWLKLSRWYVNAIYTQRYVIYVKMIKVERVQRTVTIVSSVYNKPNNDALRKLSQNNVINRFAMNT